MHLIRTNNDDTTSPRLPTLYYNDAASYRSMTILTPPKSEKHFVIYQRDMNKHGSGTDSHSSRLVPLCVHSADPEEARWSLRDGGDGVDALPFVLSVFSFFLMKMQIKMVEFMCFPFFSNKLLLFLDQQKGQSG